jgi:hypothetical protein
MAANQDQAYLQLLLSPLYECAKYRPAFGGEDKAGVSLDQFRAIYGADQLYAWIGLDSELMYAAHKAAGGMTSIYRQLGIGCERLLRAVVRDTLGLSEEQVKWSYEYPKEDGKTGVHTLDLHVDARDLAQEQAKERLLAWLKACSKVLRVPDERAAELHGIVMEVRQGYKSADSKRQNADLRFGMRASNQNYLPAIVVVSSQVSEPVIRRYQAAQMLVLVGRAGGPVQSTFTFFKDVVGYDLVRFFESNSTRLRTEVSKVLEGLLRAT